MAFPITTPAEMIGQLYVGYFGRAADPAGLDYWVSRFNDGMSLLAIANSFAVQPEATSLYAYLAAPSLGDPQAFIAAIYNGLFNRTPDAGGLAYWADQLTARGTPPGQMVLDIISGAQGADIATIQNKTHVAVAYARSFVDENVAWDPLEHIAGARAAVASVTDDPATVGTAGLGIDAMTSGYQAGFETALMSNQIKGTSEPADTGGPGAAAHAPQGTYVHFTDVLGNSDTLLIDPAAAVRAEGPVFIGAAVDYGQALALLGGGGAASSQAVYQLDENALWIDIDNNGLLNSRDIKVFIEVDIAGRLADGTVDVVGVLNALVDSLPS